MFLKQLPNDIKNIIFKIVHRDLMWDVIIQYKTFSNDWWNDDENCFVTPEIASRPNWNTIIPKATYREWFPGNFNIIILFVFLSKY